jgi:hypothetical protein
MNPRIVAVCLAACSLSGCFIGVAPLHQTARTVIMSTSVSTAVTNLTTALASNPAVASALQNVGTAVTGQSNAAQEATQLLTRYQNAMNATPPDMSTANMALMMITTISGLPSQATLLIGELSNPAIVGNAVAREQLLIQIKQALASSSGLSLNGLLKAVGLA